VIKTIIASAGHYVPPYGDSGVQDPLARWQNIGDHCSAAERRADEASRDVEAWLKCQYMRARVGEQLRGTVTGVAPFGLFVTLDALYVEGLIHVSELGAEYFQHNEVLHELRGERTGRKFRLYDSLVVQVARVDLDARRIEFQMVPSMVRATRGSRGTADADRDGDLSSVRRDDETAEVDLPIWLATDTRSPRAGQAGKKAGKSAAGKTSAKADHAKRSAGKSKTSGKKPAVAASRKSKRSRRG
jgi:ribonuclease R